MTIISGAEAHIKGGNVTMSEHDNKPLVLTVRQTAALLGLSVRSTYELCKSPHFPRLQLTANRIGVSRAGLDNWIAEQVQNKK